MSIFSKYAGKVNTLNIEEQYKPYFVQAMGCLELFVEQHPDVDIDFEMLFNKYLNNLSIRRYKDDEEDLKPSSECGRYDIDSNTIYLNKNTDLTHFCHEFVHFITRNAHPESYNGRFAIPTFVDEYSTQKLAMELTGQYTISYSHLIELIDFVQRHTEPLSTIEFLNGQTVDKWSKNVVFTNNEESFDDFIYTSNSKARSKIIANVYLLKIKELLNDKNISNYAHLLQGLATFEAEELKTGETGGVWCVGDYIKNEDKTPLYNLLGDGLISRYFKSKNIDNTLTQDQKNDVNILSMQYVNAERKKISNKYKPQLNKQVTDEDELFIQESVKMFNAVNKYIINSLQSAKSM